MNETRIMYTVIDVMDNAGMRSFLQVPRCIYAADPLHVDECEQDIRRQLDIENNPLFRTRELQMLVCMRDDVPIGRVSFVWPKEKSDEPRRGIFGYFECTNDSNAFHALFSRIAETCVRHGIVCIEGPFSPCQYGITGIQVDGFNLPPAFLEPHNPPYYERLFVLSGFMASQTGRTWRATSKQILEAGRAFLATAPNGYTVRTLRSLSDSEIGSLATVIEPAFSNNWGSVPISFEEYLYTAEGLSLAFKPGLVSVVEYEGTPVGALIMMLDINELHRGTERGAVRSLIVYAMGVVPDHRHSRAGLLLAQRFLHAASAYDTFTSTWITCGNIASELLAERFGFQPAKTFTVYQKWISVNRR